MPLDLEDDDCADGTRLVTAVDSITWRYGKSTVHVASTGAMDQVREWGMR